MVKSKYSKRCYLCGKAKPDSKDHIPPRGVFPKVPKGNLITVPAHRTCNNEYSQNGICQ